MRYNSPKRNSLEEELILDLLFARAAITSEILYILITPPSSPGSALAALDSSSPSIMEPIIEFALLS
ncbi:hypothetical protein OGAPHI_003706 [Ogataea philodendri]|uniref:Uncharacterized protein n=1 Tax=Ogataea philodendri TaxID=1378263 RepID=A0A9P8P5C1_9ASCO|nr:uncharacterized protein OGAPHI_003706 [Ogataea philodendri]KAH3665520.1 hypothetical protein OGAPHI_003706 [Ogataea philodendri]